MMLLKSGSIELIVKELLIYGNRLLMEWNEHRSLFVFFLINIFKANHRQEFIYAADSLKRRIVPILIGNFEPKGWLGEYWIAFLTFSIFMYQLGIRMTGMKYIRFRDLHQLEKNRMTELLNSILSSLSSSTPVAPQNRSLSSSTVNHVINVTPASLT